MLSPHEAPCTAPPPPESPSPGHPSSTALFSFQALSSRAVLTRGRQEADPICQAEIRRLQRELARLRLLFCPLLRREQQRNGSWRLGGEEGGVCVFGGGGVPALGCQFDCNHFSFSSPLMQLKPIRGACRGVAGCCWAHSALLPLPASRRGAKWAHSSVFGRTCLGAFPVTAPQRKREWAGRA